MSIRSLVKGERRVRPAPARAGRTRGSLEEPPDGWELLEPSAVERLAVRLDRGLLRVADAAAHQINRREFLRRLGELGVVTVAATSWLLKTATPAAARCFQCGNACGPSPPCPGAACINGDCDTGHPGVRWRDHDDWDCLDVPGQCWTADCCGCPPGQKAKKKCCDCCEDADPNNCTFPCTNKHKCICSLGLGC